VRHDDDLRRSRSPKMRPSGDISLQVDVLGAGEPSKSECTDSGGEVLQNKDNIIINCLVIVFREKVKSPCGFQMPKSSIFHHLSGNVSQFFTFGQKFRF